MDVGEVAVGGSGSVTATVTASRDVTITGVGTPTGSAFSASADGLPRTLRAGESYTVRVAFSPAVPGPDTSALTFTTNLVTVRSG
ncbi:hypothetical protein [Streptomyces sp. P9-A4]|uniref:hypothetical protein n=1 Tax=Streptomyces sp. P9-A4 TaxID=3072285 RepID=UPI002FC5BC71